MSRDGGHGMLEQQFPRLTIPTTDLPEGGLKRTEFWRKLPEIPV